MRGEGDRPLAAATADETLCAALSQRVVELLEEDCRDLRPPFTGDSGWRVAQDAIVKLAALPGADRAALAQRLVWAASRTESIGPINTIGDAAFRLMLDAAPGEIRRLVGSPEDEWAETFHFTERLWQLEGVEGVEWFKFLLHNAEHESRQEMHSMAFDGRPAWSEADWDLKLEALAEAGLERKHQLINYFFDAFHVMPRAAFPAAMGVIVAYAESSADWLAQQFAEKASELVDGTPESDVNLFYWPSGMDVAMAAWLVGATLGVDRAPATIDHAVQTGLLTEQSADMYRAVLETNPRVAIHDDSQLAGVRSLGTIEVTSEKLVLTDPSFFEGDFGWRLSVPNGEFDVTAVLASHPLHATHATAFEIVLQPTTEVTSWELLTLDTSGGGENGGYVPTNSVIGVGDPAVFEDENTDDLFEAVESALLAADGASIAGSDRLRFVMANSGTQHHESLSWVGRAADDSIVKVVVELGLVDFDPVRDGSLPWGEDASA